MKERLRRFMSAEAMNSTQLANELEIQSSGISHILSGRNKPSYDFVTKLLNKFPNLNPDWLLLGRGPMHRDEIRRKVEVASVPQETPSVSSPIGQEEQPNLFDAPKSAPVLESVASSVTETAVVEKMNIIGGRNIERIVFFFADGSFEEYRPKSK